MKWLSLRRDGWSLQHLDLFVYKALNGVAPSYMTKLLTPYSTSRPLRLADLGLLTVSCTNFKLRGDRAFAVAAPRLWNSIPPSVRLAPFIDSLVPFYKSFWFLLMLPLCLFVPWSMLIAVFVLFIILLLLYLFYSFFNCTALWSAWVVFKCAL